MLAMSTGLYALGAVLGACAFIGLILILTGGIKHDSTGRDIPKSPPEPHDD